MTGLGYMVMVSSLTAEEFADFFGLDGARVKSWCDGKEDISENAEKLISEKLKLRGYALKKQVWQLDGFEENMLFTKGVYVGVKVKASLRKV